MALVTPTSATVGSVTSSATAGSVTPYATPSPPIPVDIVSQLEPGANHPRVVDQQMLTASIAISLKRIADSLKFK